MTDPHLKTFDDLFPSAFWMRQNPSVDNYTELKYIVAVFKFWAQAQPSMPRTVSGNTELFEAFKRGWRQEKEAIERFYNISRFVSELPGDETWESYFLDWYERSNGDLSIYGRLLDAFERGWLEEKGNDERI